MENQPVSDRVPTCPACRGTDLTAGKVLVSTTLAGGIMFKPAANWIDAHYLAAVACLGCGVVTLMLREGELERLRSAARQ